MSAELYGVTLKDRNLNDERLEQFHTHSFDQHLHRQNRVPSKLPAPLGNAYVSVSLTLHANVPAVIFRDVMSALLAMLLG